MEELKPCPFCGGEAIIAYDLAYWVVSCTECPTKLTGYRHNGHIVESMTKEEAIKTWNTRHERTVKLKDNGHCPDYRKLVGTGENYCSWCGAKIEH